MNDNILQTEEQSYISIYKIFLIWWKYWKTVALIAVFLALATLLYSYLIPETFKSIAIILPETEKSKLSNLGGFSDLASLAGLGSSDASLIKLYPTIIQSETVMSGVINNKYYNPKTNDSLTLMDLWDIKGDKQERIFELVLKRLREEIEISADNKTNVLTIAIETSIPRLSADIINKITRQMDEVIRNKKKTYATEQRKWIETRLVEVRLDLDKSENNLLDFREKNRRITDSPQLLLQQERLSREMQINSTLYIELKKQYEIIKIEEIKNIPIINILDEARPAAIRNNPKRMRMILFALFFGGLFGLVYVTIADYTGIRVGMIIEKTIENTRRQLNNRLR